MQYSLVTGNIKFLLKCAWASIKSCINMGLYSGRLINDSNNRKLTDNYFDNGSILK